MGTTTLARDAVVVTKRVIMNAISDHNSQTSEQRVRAYRTLLSVAVLHVKWDLACVESGFAWLNPLRFLAQIRAVRTAAYRARAFHNLAIAVSRDLNGFQEDQLWKEIDWFHRKCMSDRSGYRDVFETCLANESPDVLALSLSGRISEEAKQ